VTFLPRQDFIADGHDRMKNFMVAAGDHVSLALVKQQSSSQKPIFGVFRS
jgi:hypothetical protein